MSVWFGNVLVSWIAQGIMRLMSGDGAALDPLVWSAGARPQRRRVGQEEHGRAMLPALRLFGGLTGSDWVTLPSTAVAIGDVGAWPYSVGLLVKWVTLLGTLHWPAAAGWWCSIC